MRSLACGSLACWMVWAAASAASGAEPSPGSQPSPADRVWDLLDMPALRWIPQVRALRARIMVGLFPRWPYRDGHAGYLAVVPFFRSDRRYRLWGGRIALSGGGDGRRALAEAAGDIDTTARLGAMVRLRRTWSDDAEASGSSGIAVGTFRLVQADHAMARVGLGLRWSTLSGRSGAGPAAALRIDLFPRAPWTARLTADAGSIGAHGVATLEIDAARLVRAVEARVGFLWQSSYPSFHGPVAGLAYWF